MAALILLKSLTIELFLRGKQYIISSIKILSECWMKYMSYNYCKNCFSNPIRDCSFNSLTIPYLSSYPKYFQSYEHASTVFCLNLKFLIT